MTLPAGSPYIGGDAQTVIETLVDDKVAELVWQTWTPTLTNTTATVTTARYTKVGTTVHYVLALTCSGASVGTTPSFTVPVPPAAHYGTTIPIGTATYVDVNPGNRWEGIALATSGSTVTMYYATEAGGGSGTVITSSAPFTWASGDLLVCWGTYEAAS